MAAWSTRPAEIQLGGTAFPTRLSTQITSSTVGDIMCSGKPTEGSVEFAGTRTTRKTNRTFTRGSTPMVSSPRPTEKDKRLRWWLKLPPITWGRFSLRSESWIQSPSQRRNWFTWWSNRTKKKSMGCQKRSLLSIETVFVVFSPFWWQKSTGRTAWCYPDSCRTITKHFGAKNNSNSLWRAHSLF